MARFNLPAERGNLDSKGGRARRITSLLRRQLLERRSFARVQGFEENPGIVFHFGLDAKVRLNVWDDEDGVEQEDEGEA